MPIPTVLRGPSPPPARQGTGALCSGHAGRNVFSALGSKTSPKTTGVLIHPLSQIPAQGWPEHPRSQFWMYCGWEQDLRAERGGLTCGLQRASDSRGYPAVPSQWMQALAIRAASRVSVYSSRFLRRQPRGATACPLRSEVALTWVGSMARGSCLSQPCPSPAGVDPCVCAGPRSGALHPAGDLLVGGSQLVSGSPGWSGCQRHVCVQL